MPRRRSKKYRELVANLFFDKTTGHYRYRHLGNHRVFAMGRDKDKAINAAKKLNAQLTPVRNLITHVMGHQMTLSEFIQKRYVVIFEERQLAESTIIDYHNKIATIHKVLGHYPIDDISVKHIADFLYPFPLMSALRFMRSDRSRSSSMKTKALMSNSLLATQPER